MESEKATEKYLVQQVKLFGGECVKFQGGFGSRGFPDRICIMPNGLVLFVECKSEGKKLSPIQEVWFKVLNKLGHNIYMVSRKIEIDELLLRWRFTYARCAGNIKGSRGDFEPQPKTIHFKGTLKKP